MQRRDLTAAQRAIVAARTMGQMPPGETVSTSCPHCGGEFRVRVG